MRATGGTAGPGSGSLESGKYFGLPKECYCNVSGFVADTPSWG